MNPHARRCGILNAFKNLIKQYLKNLCEALCVVILFPLGVKKAGHNDQLFECGTSGRTRTYQVNQWLTQVRSYKIRNFTFGSENQSERHCNG